MLVVLLAGMALFPEVAPEPEKKDMALIVETEDTPEQVKKQIEKDYPFVEIVATYDILFQGIAIKGKPKNLEGIVQEDFIKAVYPVQTYKTLEFKKTLAQKASS